MTKLDLLHRTRVYKLNNGLWRTTYLLPYSGPLECDHLTWDEAWETACHVEEQRPWI